MVSSQVKAEIEKAATLIKSTDDRINELKEDIGRWNRSTKSAKDVRTKEKQDFTRAQARLLQTGLLQVQSRHRSAPPMPADLMKALAVLAQEPSDSSDSDSLSESVTRSLAASTVALTQNEAETQEVTL